MSELKSRERHGVVLEERERKLARGEAVLLDWETAMRQLRSKTGLPENNI